MTIQERVDKLTRYYGTNDPFAIARELGVIIVRYGLNGVRGFYHHFQRCDIIYIDERLPDHIQSLVCAHELGHMLLHKTANAIFMDTRTQFNTYKYEIEANTFAMELLVPNEVILENIYSTTEQLSRMLGYEKALIELRLESFRSI